MFEKFWVKEEKENDWAACLLFSLAFSLAAVLITFRFVSFRVLGQNYQGLIAVLITSLAVSYPLINYLEKREKEQEEGERWKEGHLVERHWSELEVYLSFFFGTTGAFLIANYLLPDEFFSIQSAVIGSITGKFVSEGIFVEILLNNLSVFFLTFLLSFVFTAGMVFILVWNASVLGVFLSDISKSLLHLPFVALAYLPHGIFEIAAYIFAGLSGFFLSHQIEYFLKTGERKALGLSRDSVLILLIGLVFLVAGGTLESL